MKDRSRPSPNLFEERHYEEAVNTICQRSGLSLRGSARLPRIGLVLGSSMGDVARELTDSSVLEYQEIPHFPTSSAPGHHGRLCLGNLSGVPVVLMQGRVHFYEGYSPEQLVFPVRVMQRLGVEVLLLTNAAGGVREGLAVGDLMLLEDHLNFAGMSGHDPLRGPNVGGFGERFVSMNRAYDPELLELAERVAADQGQGLTRGVYGYVAGPSFETPAEIRFLRLLGVHAVGMSTVPEVLAARHAGMRVLALSVISNLAIDSVDSPESTTAEEVWQSMAEALPRLRTLLAGIVAELQAAT